MAKLAQSGISYRNHLIRIGDAVFYPVLISCVIWLLWGPMVEGIFPGAVKQGLISGELSAANAFHLFVLILLFDHGR